MNGNHHLERILYDIFPQYDDISDILNEIIVYGFKHTRLYHEKPDAKVVQDIWFEELVLRGLGDLLVYHLLLIERRSGSMYLICELVFGTGNLRPTNYEYLHCRYHHRILDLLILKCQ